MIRLFQRLGLSERPADEATPPAPPETSPPKVSPTRAVTPLDLDFPERLPRPGELGPLTYY